ncbi:MAG: hypothetical protein HY651_03960 [Acidobacteria bacterium]|nr:hypothetical protein [Acidobacteriota bacterium]
MARRNWRRSRAKSFAKASLYHLYFNLARPSSHLDLCTPWQIVAQLVPRAPVNLCLHPPINLDCFLNPQGGNDVPSHPWRIAAAFLAERYFLTSYVVIR